MRLETRKKRKDIATKGNRLSHHGTKEGSKEGKLEGEKEDRKQGKKDLKGRSKKNETFFFGRHL